MKDFSKYISIICRPFKYGKGDDFSQLLTTYSIFTLMRSLSCNISHSIKDLLCPGTKSLFRVRINSNSFRYRLCALLFSLFVFFPLFAQRFAVKNNFLHDGFLSPNLGVEVALSPKLTFNISADYKPFTVTKDKTLKEWMIQPEIRYWLCEPFEGHFFSIQYTYAEFNFSRFPFRGMKDKHVEGNVNAAGLSYGYNRILSPYWSLEGSLGVGVARLHYSKYRCEHCGYKEGTYNRTYLVPVNAAVSIMYLFK